MFIKQDFNLIVTVVNRGFSDPVLVAAREAGAEGATIFAARGTGVHETDTFMGVAIQPEKDVVLVLVKKAQRKKVMRAIIKKTSLSEEGRGLCFSLPVDEISGVNHLLNNFLSRSSTQKKSAKPTVKPKSSEPAKSLDDKHKPNDTKTTDDKTKTIDTKAMDSEHKESKSKEEKSNS